MNSGTKVLIAGMGQDQLVHFKEIKWPTDQGEITALHKAQAEEIFAFLYATIPARTMDALADIFFRQDTI